MVQVSKDTKCLNLGARESFRDKAITAANYEGANFRNAMRQNPSRRGAS